MTSPTGTGPDRRGPMMDMSMLGSSLERLAVALRTCHEYLANREQGLHPNGSACEDA